MADFIRDVIEYKLQIANGEEKWLKVFTFDTSKITVAMKNRLLLSGIGV